MKFSSNILSQIMKEYKKEKGSGYVVMSAGADVLCEGML